MTTRHFIIDTDTASDDAVAIVMALQWPDVEVDAITVVYGNMPLEIASANARYSVEICGKETPVYEGCARPLLRSVAHADWFHGPEGMGKLGRLHPKRPAAGQNAVEELIRRFGAAPGEITLVTLGPLTNIAAALIVEPRLAEWVKECYIMGGAANCVGNVTPAAEFNIWCDPEAARMVFHSGLPVEMVGWELCRGEANLSEADMRYCREVINTPLAHFAIDCNATAIKANQQWLGDPALALPDPVAMAIAIDPTICTRSSRHYVEVECDGTFTRGMTVVDQQGVTANVGDPSVAMWGQLVQRGAPNATVCWEIDIPRWKALLYQTLQ